jgi:hypothetical protein
MIRGEVKSAIKMKLAGGFDGVLFAKNNAALQLIRIEQKNSLGSLAAIAGNL